MGSKRNVSLSLREGDRGPLVSTVQRLLLGHYEGKVDGIWGPKTQAALERCYKNRGWDPTLEVRIEGPEYQIVNEYDLHILTAYAVEKVRHLKRDVAMLAIDQEDLEEAESVPIHDETWQEKCVDFAEAEWRKDIREPTKKEFMDPAKVPPAGKKHANWNLIDRFITGILGLVWSWKTKEAKKEGREIYYAKNSIFAWCGAFVAFVLGCVGLSKYIRLHVMASTGRIFRWLNEHPDRRVPPKDVRKGDVVIVGNPKKTKAGSHITVCAKVLRHPVEGEVLIQTYEGNATGEGPNAEEFEGVITRKRATDKAEGSYQILYGCRFKDEDKE